MKNKKIIINKLVDIANEICQEKIKPNDDLFLKMDSLNLMNFISDVEKKFKKKFKIEKLLDRKKLDIIFISNELN